MSIKLNNIKKSSFSGNKLTDAVFVDLSLDMGFTTRDLKVSLDEFAIKNALVTLLNTRVGENILRPEFGLNLQKDLFTQMTEANGYALADRIREGINRFEPRVKIDSINITIKPETQEYDVIVNIVIPALKYRTTFTGIFNNQQTFRETT